ncbi:hypothetical protein CEXT_556281 [Caerostris extrusa]|uniref:Uncharacterized protein n=1 Tax=Caerostris extrusa TaxID=172846 RepID=A0AAV4X0N7_CAEEX|nr:hypothetical protein CEXT_556281 [Caerostris extrusa]
MGQQLQNYGLVPVSKKSRPGGQRMATLGEGAGEELHKSRRRKGAEESANTRKDSPIRMRIKPFKEKRFHSRPPLTLSDVH